MGREYVMVSYEEYDSLTDSADKLRERYAELWAKYNEVCQTSAMLRADMAAARERQAKLRAENEKLRELARGLDYCAHEAYGMCARVPVGGGKPFTCCPIYDFDSGEYGCVKLKRELGIEVEA